MEIEKVQGLVKVDKPEWIVMKKTALSGNILITGSIGTGKSQGTILPYLDQIMANFEPRPSVLALDPKNTFIPTAVQIMIARGHKDHILRLSLDGETTFNPIYHPNPLEESRFLDIAQMIRAASINFMGKAFESPFWEISAFNLIKNALVYCAAVYDYYTLRDLYQVMVGALEGGFVQKLVDTLTEERFSDEARYNIDCAIKYFSSEYSQLDEKVRTGILATSTSFLNQFQEYRAGRIFCPTKEKLSFYSMDQVIDEGKLLLFDVKSPALARSMGTFVKLHYQQSILNRLASTTRTKDRSAVLIIDEYQDVVSSGGGSTIGDERFLAKSREANAITIAAMQSLTSIENSLGNDKAAHELFQNFRTRIMGHSSDLATIKNFQELAGQFDKEQKSHSVSELSQHTERNLILGGFDLTDATISESISTSEKKEHLITGKEVSRLKTFEAYALIYDGVSSFFTKLFLKPFFLEKKETSHKALLGRLAAGLMCILVGLGLSSKAQAFPNVCTVLKTPQFRSCLEFSVGTCMCGFPIPRPCAQFNYYVPVSYVEVVNNPGESFFDVLPGAAIQLSTLTSRVPFAAQEDDHTFSFHAHALQVPFTSIPYNYLPCRGGAYSENMCFGAMSEHVDSHWHTGEADRWQPKHLAWGLSPKACLIAGAASGAFGGSNPTYGIGSPHCSIPMDWMPKYPPSNLPVCSGWGIHYPRYGTYHGADQTAGALMIASRLKSLGTEIFQTIPTAVDEKWQMIYPQATSCFREGENLGSLLLKGVNEMGRLTGGPQNNYLFVVYKKVSCCRDLAEIATAYAGIEIMSAVCQAF
ncbi:MAG: type IV secretion system DNA-binding domain-containing protein [Bacteriovoracia bacterium]